MDEQDFDFAAVNLEDAKELGTLPDGTVARMVVTNTRVSSPTSILVFLEVAETEAGDDVSLMADVTKFLNIPEKGDKTKRANNDRLDAQKFFKGFLGKPQPGKLSEVIGATCWWILNEKPDNEGRLRNKLKYNGCVRRA